MLVDFWPSATEQAELLRGKPPPKLHLTEKIEVEAG